MITGGESGGNPEYLFDPAADWREGFHTKGRRIMLPEWANNLRLKSQAAEIPFYFKQITAFRPGQGEDALGALYKEYPSPPHSQWADKIRGY